MSSTPATDAISTGITVWNRSLGNLNVRIYPPGERLVPIPGCPIYPDHWTCAWWYPGVREHVTLHHSQDDAALYIKARQGGL